MYKPRLCYDLSNKIHVTHHKGYIFSFSSRIDLGRFVEATWDIKQGDIHTVENFMKRYNINIDLELLGLIKLYTEIQRRGFYVEHGKTKTKYFRPEFCIDVEW